MNYLKIIENSLQKLVTNDIDLIKRKLKEECINHCFAKYIEQEIKEYCSNISLSVDLEYDKNYGDSKNMTFSNGQVYSIRPDIIVHQRGSNNVNKIYIECKKPYLTKEDKEKLVQARNHPYNYKFSIGICYLPEKNYMRLYVANQNSSFTSYKFDKTSKRIQEISNLGVSYYLKTP